MKSKKHTKYTAERVYAYSKLYTLIISNLGDGQLGKGEVEMCVFRQKHTKHPKRFTRILFWALFTKKGGGKKRDDYKCWILDIPHPQAGLRENTGYPPFPSGLEGEYWISPTPKRAWGRILDIPHPQAGLRENTGYPPPPSGVRENTGYPSPPSRLEGEYWISPTPKRAEGEYWISPTPKRGEGEY